jgi:hypothetical protein
LSTSCVIFSYPKLLSISVLTFIKWRLNTELLMNTLRNVVFSTNKADHRYRKLINYALSWARPTLFIYLLLTVFVLILWYASIPYYLNIVPPYVLGNYSIIRASQSVPGWIIQIRKSNKILIKILLMVSCVVVFRQCNNICVCFVQNGIPI